MRGKVPHSFVHHLSTRITPAYAGKRRTLDEVQDCDRDHPRLCGEKYGYYTIEVSPLGSPPPMRGKVLDAGGFRKAVRITPAYAGKRLERVPLIPSRQDHPRLCGEKRHRHRIRGIPPGSPPPMRGKVPSVGTCKTPVGITPAYAGKSAAVRRKPCSL